ncbi:hypothetical protein IAR55_001356 [Kwoniella newhampshirensis]|uniref:Uracil transporter FurD n=1 Tax=Kwoniella newhampshirensis TaxID=1651941 RepID=A0AAW0Z1X3_9TREE
MHMDSTPSGGLRRVNKATIKARLTTTSAWALPKEESRIAPDDVYTNKDMDPSPPEMRLWTAWTFFAYWCSDLINPGTFAGSAGQVVALGLTWWEACLANILGQFLVAIVITANGIIGAKLHTPFAVSARSVYGYWGSKFPVFSRMVIACFWLSINSWTGGVYVTLMIQAIWPQYARLKNSIPVSEGATSRDFLSFFLFWAMQLPFIMIHPSKLAWVFNVKAVAVPCVALATMIWCLVEARPNVSQALNHQANRAAPGSARFQAFIYAVTSTQGTWATLALNIGDFSRYCKRPNSAYVQLFALPVISGLLSIIGAISAACTLAIYNEDLYQPYDITGKWGVSHGGRAAMFIATSNSISAANDLATLVPKYVNIRRGQLIVITIGVFGFAPWKVTASASNLLSFMSSYSIVLAPMGVLLATDFFIVKRQKVNIYQLYQPKGIYRFSKGWNWRAFVALACGIGPNMPGMVNAINANINIGNIHYLYLVSNISSNLFAMSVYLALNKFFPAHAAIIDVAVHDVLTPEDGMVHDTAFTGVEGKEKMDENVSVQPVL